MTPASAPPAAHAPTVPADPACLSPIEWSTRLAAYTGRGRPGDDPDVLACRAALAYWRVRRAIDAEADHLGTAGLHHLIEALLAPHAGAQA